MLSQANINRALTERALAKTNAALSKTQSFRGYHPSHNLYMNKRAGWWDDTKGTLGAYFDVGQPDYSIRMDGPNTTTQYDFAGPATAEEIAAASKGKKTKEDVQAWLDRTKFDVGQPDYSIRMDGPNTTTQYDFAGPATAEEIASGKQYPGSGNWFTANNNSNLKDIGIGVGTGALTYGATGLIPGLKKRRLVRALLALAAGGAAGYYGSNIRGQA